jgi:RNA polymerase sigma-70 factor, ECF subfamily
MSEPAPDLLPSSGEIELRLAARPDDREALGRLLEAYRPYLLLIANKELPAGLQAKFGASDVVQRTFHEAVKDFARFEGSTEEELRAWLRRMLLHNLADMVIQFTGTDKRDPGREVPPYPGVESPSESPSQQAVARERDEALHRALEQLSAEARQVVQWHAYDRCTFEEIGQRLGRSAEAARKIWARALKKLREILEQP